MGIKASYIGINNIAYKLWEAPPDKRIFGAEWVGTSDPAWTRTDDSASFADPSPAVNNGTGSSPFDDIYPWAGMQIVEDVDGGTLVEIPKFYYKWVRDGSKMKLQISNVQHDGFLCSPAHADRGDGVGERDFIYVGRYHCADSTYKSTTGVAQQVSETRATFRRSIHNLGSNYWQWDYAILWTIRMLYLVEFAHWDSQDKIGYGCSASYSKANNGQTDSMMYHTGTTAVSRTKYGFTQYRHIEGLWDNVYDWCDGIYFSSANVYCIKNPANFSDTANGTLVGTRATSNGTSSVWTNPSVSGFEYAIYPSAVVEDSTSLTYVCDYSYYHSSADVLFVGGCYTQYRRDGLFSMYGYDAASGTGTLGSRLMKLP